MYKTANNSWHLYAQSNTVRTLGTDSIYKKTYSNNPPITSHSYSTDRLDNTALLLLVYMEIRYLETAVL
jgi:hypothetical protein